jgi:hypothetical protein
MCLDLLVLLRARLNRVMKIAWFLRWTRSRAMNRATLRL